MAVVVVLVTAAAVVVLLHDQERAVTKLLDATVALADDVDDPPLDTWLVIRNAVGQNATSGLPAGADDRAAFAAVVAGGPPTTTEHRVGGVAYRTMTERRTDGFVVQAVLDLTPRQDDRSRILAAMLTAGAAGLVLAAAARHVAQPARAGAAVGRVGAATPVRRRRRARAAHAADPDRHPRAAAAAAPAEGARRRRAATGLVGRRPAHGRHPRRPRPPRRRRRRGRQRAPHRDPRGPAARGGPAHRPRAAGRRPHGACAATRCGRRVPWRTTGASRCTGRTRPPNRPRSSARRWRCTAP